MAAVPHSRASEGWFRFALAMLVASAIANSLYGIVGLTGDDHFVSDELLFGAVELWGGVALVIGAIEFMIVLLVVKRVPSGVPLAVMIVGLNAVAQLMAIGAYPIWSVIVLVIDGLVIYGLTARAHRAHA